MILFPGSHESVENGSMQQKDLFQKSFCGKADVHNAHIDYACSTTWQIQNVQMKTSWCI